jgi:ABC-type iron transport system FetAB permease component
MDLNISYVMWIEFTNQTILNAQACLFLLILPFVFCVIFSRPLLSLFFLAIVLSVLVQITTSDYYFGIFKLLIIKYRNVSYIACRFGFFKYTDVLIIDCCTWHWWPSVCTLTVVYNSHIHMLQSSRWNLAIVSVCDTIVLKCYDNNSNHILVYNWW